MTKVEILDLTQLSEEELIDLECACKTELSERDCSQFPYKIGDCFCDTAPGSKELNIIRIDKLSFGVFCTIITVDILKNATEFKTNYGYKRFMKEFKTPIDSSVFDLFHENAKAIEELKSSFVNEVFKLRKNENK